jgi:transposase
MSDKTEILKTDALGRVRMPPEKREVILDEFERSAMSGQKFAGRIGVNYQTFATWVQKRRKARGQYPKLGRPAKARGLTLVEAVVGSPEPVAGGGVELVTAGGHRIRVKRAEDIALATGLVRALEGQQGC